MCEQVAETQAEIFPYLPEYSVFASRIIKYIHRTANKGRIILGKHQNIFLVLK